MVTLNIPDDVINKVKKVWNEKNPYHKITKRNRTDIVTEILLEYAKNNIKEE